MTSKTTEKKPRFFLEVKINFMLLIIVKNVFRIVTVSNSSLCKRKIFKNLL